MQIEAEMYIGCYKTCPSAFINICGEQSLVEAPDSDHEEKIPWYTTLYDESKIRNTIMTNQKLEKSKTHQSRVSCKKISKSKKK